jgi:hypothetical protein
MDCFFATARNDELKRFGQPLNVIASFAKQSRATLAGWIASSQGLLAMTEEAPPTGLTVESPA